MFVAPLCICMCADTNKLVRTYSEESLDSKKLDFFFLKIESRSLIYVTNGQKKIN